LLQYAGDIGNHIDILKLENLPKSKTGKLGFAKDKNRYKRGFIHVHFDSI